MITRQLLHALRNDLPMVYTIEKLGVEAPDHKYIDARLRFVCPCCNDFQAVLNPNTNLAKCFNCGKRINNIDLLLLIGFDFLEAIRCLNAWLSQCRNEHPKRVCKQPPDRVTQLEKSKKGSAFIGQILRRELGKNVPKT